MSKGRLNEELLENAINGVSAEQQKAEEYSDRIFGYIFGAAERKGVSEEESFRKVLDMVRSGSIPIPKNDSQMASDIGVINALLRFARTEKGGFIAINQENLEVNQGLQISGNIISIQGNDKKRTILDIVNSLNYLLAQNEILIGSPTPSNSPQNTDSEPFLSSKTIQNYIGRGGRSNN